MPEDTWEEGEGIDLNGASQHVLTSLTPEFVGQVATISDNLTLRRSASRFTSSITGNAPVPVPITRRRQFQGISSSTESGVCPKSPRNCLDTFFLRFRTRPRSITTSCS